MAGRRIRVEHAHPVVYRVGGAAAAPLLAVLAGKALILAAAFAVTPFYHGYGPPSMARGALFCLFGAVGLLFVFLFTAALAVLALWWALGRSATTVEPLAHRVVRWWGLLVPMYARACRFQDIAFVEVSAQRAGWDKSDYSVAVRYGPEHKRRIVVQDELGARTAATDLGHAVAAAVGRPVRDTSGGQL